MSRQKRNRHPANRLGQRGRVRRDNCRNCGGYGFVGGGENCKACNGTGKESMQGMLAPRKPGGSP